MKISEFIKELEKFKKENGDLDIAIYRGEERGNLSDNMFLDIDICKRIEGDGDEVFKDYYMEERPLEKGKEFCGLY